MKIEKIEIYLPKKVVTNQDLNRIYPNWKINIVSKKSGVLKRHIAEKSETAFDLSKKACIKLFEKVDKGTIDGIIYCTQSQDHIMPANSFLLHNEFNLKKNIFTLDINHACSGFIYCMILANSIIKSKSASKILIVNSDTYSKYMRNNDRATRCLFGDGAAVTVVSKNRSSKILDQEIGTFGLGFKNFWIPDGGNRNRKGKNNKIIMDGMKVWSFINSHVPKQIITLLNRNNLKTEDINHYIFHQASLLTIDSIRKELKLDPNKMTVNIRDIGNTVSASIPFALKEAIDFKKIKKGDKIMMSGFGVGLSYGSILYKF